MKPLYLIINEEIVRSEAEGAKGRYIGRIPSIIKELDRIKVGEEYASIIVNGSIEGLPDCTGRDVLLCGGYAEDSVRRVGERLTGNVEYHHPGLLFGGDLADSFASPRVTGEVRVGRYETVLRDSTPTLY